MAGSDVAQRCRAASEAAVVWDRSHLGRLRGTGKDVVDLLNRLSTNLVDPLPPGRVVTTILTTNKGRILDVLTLCSAQESLLVMTSAGALDKVAAWLDQYTFTEDAAFADISLETAQLTVVGPRAPELLRAALGGAAGGLAERQCVQVRWRENDLLLARTDPLGAPGYDVITPRSAAASLRDHLVRVGKPLGAIEADAEPWEVLRILAGVPRYGHELTEQNNPLEAELHEAVSWSKGCYIGQEVVARLRTYHKVQRYLVRLAFAGNILPPLGSKLMSEEKEIGFVTSAVAVPDEARIAALGYVRTAFVRKGLEVRAVLPDGTAVPGHVVWAPELPAEALTPAQLLALAEEPEEA